ncbi:MAG: GtrA family protein [Chloroflexi bacterium]|nr:GtrA family protein [Chloroflexota bacterium]
METASQSSPWLPAVELPSWAQQLYSRHRRQFSRYFVVGICGALVNSGLLFLLVQAGGLNHILAATLACELSIISNFALHDYWTFAGTKTETSWLRRCLSYNTVALTGIVFTVLTLAALTTGFHMHYMIANIFAMGAATVSNYTLNSRFTWARASITYQPSAASSQG